MLSRDAALAVAIATKHVALAQVVGQGGRKPATAPIHLKQPSNLQFYPHN